jgi:phosphatidylglycerol:prolipoprotein diacylglycerol transferase
MLIFPNINPVAFSIGPLKVHWYGLMYLLGFALAWLLAKWRVKKYHLAWNEAQISDLIFYCAIGVILGGRLGYMLFYHTSLLVTQPLTLFRLWEGGMSFHGGLIGVFFAVMIFAKMHHKTFWEVADFTVPLVPLGLAAGRAGNFINGELWGRVTDMPWGMVFPQVGNLPRHPSQLYEFGLEGIVLFIIIWWYADKPRPAGCVSAVFLILYSLARLFVEAFREPDSHIGFIAFGWLTMGQLLSLPILLFGLTLWGIRRNANLPSPT